MKEQTEVKKSQLYEFARGSKTQQNGKVPSDQQVRHGAGLAGMLIKNGGKNNAPPPRPPQ